MRGILVDCIEHGVNEDKQGIVFGAGVSISMAGNRVPCPVCGRLSPNVDGEYRVDATTNDMVVHVKATPAQLRRLQNAVRWAENQVQSHETDDAKVQDKLRRTIEREVPELAEVADRTLGSRATIAAAWISVVVALFALLSDGHVPELSADAVQSIVNEAYARSGDLPPSEPFPNSSSMRGASDAAASSVVWPTEATGSTGEPMRLAREADSSWSRRLELLQADQVLGASNFATLVELLLTSDRERWSAPGVFQGELGGIRIEWSAPREHTVYEIDETGEIYTAHFDFVRNMDADLETIRPNDALAFVRKHLNVRS